MLLERPDAVVAHHPHDVHAVAGERVELHPGEAERPVAQQQHDLALGSGELRRERIARPRAEAAERPRVEPAPGLVAVDHAAGVGDVVPAVADHDRVAVEHRAELRVQPHRVQRRPRRPRARPARPRAARPRRRAAHEIHASLASACSPAAARRSSERRTDRAVALRRDRPRMAALGLGRVDHDDLRVLAEGPAEAEPEVHRHADHQRHVGALQRLRARAREEQLVVGGDAAAREPVEEHRDPQRLGQPRELLARRAPSRDPCPP